MKLSLMGEIGQILSLPTTFVGMHFRSRVYKRTGVYLMKCERCQKNPARVRVDQPVDGRRESHFLCQSCVDELMNAMGQMSGFDGQSTPDTDPPFGFSAN